MSNFDPDVLFWALSHAIQNNIADSDAMGIRASVKEYLGISGIRMPDRVLLDTLRRRLDTSELNIPEDRIEEVRIDIVDNFGEKFNNIFEGLEDLFKL